MTARQKQIVMMLPAMPRKQIASALHCSQKTVDWHLAAAKRGLRMQDCSDIQLAGRLRVLSGVSEKELTVAVELHECRQLLAQVVDRLNAIKL